MSKKLLDIIKREELFDLYITKNNTAQQCADILNVKKHNIYFLLNSYGIKKDKKAVYKKRTENYIKKYGMKSTPWTEEKRKKMEQTCLERYGNSTFAGSKAHKEKMKKILNEKYGVDNISQIPEVKEKKKQSAIDKYGVQYTFQAEEVKEKSKQTKLERYSDEYYNNPEKHKQTCLINHGVKYPMQSSKIREKSKETYLEKYGGIGFASEQLREKQRETMLEKYGVENALQSSKIASKIRKNQLNIQAEDGTYLDSSWELDVYNYFLRNNIPIERNIPIKYTYNGKEKVTFIDFRVDNVLLEVKAQHLLEGCFDHKLEVPIKKKLELYDENNVVIITAYKELFYKSDNLQGIDIDLFRNPKFPYKEDRPKCFYHTKVNNQRSCYDAFQDEKFRWEMMKNRLQYTKGFISSNSIVYAMNVTRRSKQPSWFSTKLAEEIINKYTTHETIIDPFAGWGTRYKASKNSGKNYIGIDSNEELIEWYKENGHNLICKDIRDFKYYNNCSVIMCPPYGDIEIYSDNQDYENLECDWLEIVMKNIPNANEYVMVCKNVNDKFKPFIVDTIENNSHFNSGKEYILCIKKR